MTLGAPEFQPLRGTRYDRSRRWFAALLTISGCGRFDFDPIAPGGDALGSDLIVWLEMNDAPAPNVVDSSGYAHDGVCVTTCPSLVPAIRGNGLHLNGVNDAIEIADLPELRLPQGTATMWVRLDLLPASPNVFTMSARPFGALDHDTFEVLVDSNGTLTFGGDSGPARYVAFTTSANRWFHIALTWDGDSLVGYLDGVPKSATGFAITYDAHPIMIGHDSDNNIHKNFLSGTLDDVRIYRRALSAAEISVLATP